ncbi:phospho-sugar mutase [Bacillus sp. S/N-304-OC-R1]|uniref:phospho-sugar mutase n=1 Tax=Bacillus sp. S/N-304-OC-R1 TaxID=2758034 RepID=UPI001C8E54EB|nr:phospho-sugar mutase [Bacillus sp. S/N-304-OC-R1]MBY0121152.1 phospho-sugar mutase [Bacillus sp. S/N-304-OC-R1]
MDFKQSYNRWLQFEGLEPELKNELLTFGDNETLIKDAFFKDLEFGTGGMRGEIGAGTNRMNTYTVRKATQGMAEYIKLSGAASMSRGVVIAFDSRRKSPQFSQEAAATLARNGVKVYLYDGPRTTPQLSFSVRKLNAFMGIMMTASHNPPEYNGYKVYGEDGAQLNLEQADAVIGQVHNVGDELAVPSGEFAELKADGMIEIIGKELDEDYRAQLLTVQKHPSMAEASSLRAVFTPLHGASGQSVRDLFAHTGYKHIYYVEEQMKPDGEFPTVKSPNPEEASAFELAIRDGQKHGVDILLAADPDGDRVGVAVRKNDEYQLLTGNQTGAILIEYLLSQMHENGDIPANGRIFKTIVTSELGRVIGEHYGVSTEDVLTGFKFIGEKIKNYEATGEFSFLFGYEESYGYLIKDFARDKDALQALLAITEAAAFYKEKGKSLLDVLDELYDRHGYYLEGLVSVTKKGAEGVRAIQQAMDALREQPIKDIGGLKIASQEDYLKRERTFGNGQGAEALHLPKSNVMKYFLEDGSWICVRPSGTEPKIKYYFGVRSDSKQGSEERLANLKELFTALMENL